MHGVRDRQAFRTRNSAHSWLNYWMAKTFSDFLFVLPKQVTNEAIIDRLIYLMSSCAMMKCKKNVSRKQKHKIGELLLAIACHSDYAMNTNGTTNAHEIHLLGLFEQRMTTSDQFSQMHCNIGHLIAEQPAQTEERRWISDNLFRLTDCTIPIVLLNAFRRDFFQFRTTGRCERAFQLFLVHMEAIRLRPWLCSSGSLHLIRVHTKRFAMKPATGSTNHCCRALHSTHSARDRVQTWNERHFLALSFLVFSFLFLVRIFDMVSTSFFSKRNAESAWTWKTKRRRSMRKKTDICLG